MKKTKMFITVKIFGMKHLVLLVKRGDIFCNYGRMEVCYMICEAVTRICCFIIPVRSSLRNTNWGSASSSRIKTLFVLLVNQNALQLLLLELC
jgi:hypothetical protein